MNIDPKTFKSYDGYKFDESEFIEKTGFKVIKEFSISCRDDDYNFAIGKIDGELYWYQSNWGSIWKHDFGKIE